MKEIIIAEDDQAIREILQIILQRAGYKATAYSNGDELIANEFALPDLFIIDKQLSGIDGLEVCRFLKSQASTQMIPVIIISASPLVSASAIAAGASEFIEKPFKTKPLLESIARQLAIAI